MPKLSQKEWQDLDVVARWLIATRSAVLFMTAMSAGLGGLLAARAGHFEWHTWLLCLLGLLFAHATNNLLNDYTDSRLGIDKNNYYRNQYGVHVLEDGLLTLAQFQRYLGFTAGVALMCGATLVWQHGGQTLNLMLAGAFFVVFYTWPLKYFGLGEPAVLLVWGPLMLGGTFYVVAGHWSWSVTWLSLLYALGPTTVLFGKHIDKIDMDAKKRVRTLPVLLGESQARRWVIVMLAAQYLSTIGLVLSGAFHWALLLVLFSLSSFWKLTKIYRSPKPSQRPERFPEAIWPLWFSAYAFSHTRKFTSLFVVGLVLDYVLPL